MQRLKMKASAILERASFDDLSKGFGAASGIATLLHDNEAARFFKNAQALSQEFVQLIALSAEKTFAETPGAYCNIYVAIALLIANMMEESQKQDAMQEMYACTRRSSLPCDW